MSKIVPIEDKHLLAIGIDPRNCKYISSTYNKDIKGYKRLHSAIINGTNDPESLYENDIIIQINDERPHVGVVCYAIFPCDIMDDLVHISKRGKDNFWFDLYRAVPLAPFYMSRHGKFGAEIVLRQIQGMSNFSFSDDLIKI